MSLSHTPALLSVDAAAHIIGISAKTVRNWLSAGRFPVKTVKVGDRRLVVAADLDRFLAELTGSTTTHAAEPAPRRRGRPRKNAAGAGEGGAQ